MIEQKHELFSKFSDHALNYYVDKLLGLLSGDFELGCCGLCSFLGVELFDNSDLDAYDLLYHYMIITELTIHSYGIMDEARTNLAKDLVFDISYYLVSYYLENK